MNIVPLRGFIDKEKSYVFFYGKDSIYSNFYPAPFTIDGITYKYSETYFMKKKQELFDGSNITLANQIMNESNPTRIKALGRQVKNYDNELWNLHREDIMYTAVLHKFNQNIELKKLLLATNDAILVESSPRDRIWGIGYGSKNALKNQANWGANNLGHILMKVREELKAKEIPMMLYPVIKIPSI